MKIKCKLAREGGTVVTLGASTYHFKPEGPGSEDHVCDVNSKEHIARLLAIPEAYEILEPVTTRKTKATEPAKKGKRDEGDGGEGGEGGDGEGDGDGGAGVSGETKPNAPAGKAPGEGEE